MDFLSVKNKKKIKDILSIDNIFARYSSTCIATIQDLKVIKYYIKKIYMINI